jgi:UDP-glucose 4-epimerase
MKGVLPVDQQWPYKNQVILVTGGAGAIGSLLVRRLVQAGAAKVMVLDDLSSGLRSRVCSSGRVDFVRGSIANKATLDRLFARRPQVVFHLAAFFANQNSVEHPEQDLIVNGLGTLRLLQAAVRWGVKRFIYTASSSSSSNSQADEKSCAPALATPYQMTKFLGEFYCKFFGRHHDLHVCCARLFNSYGPGELPGRYRNVIPNWIFRALQREPLPVTGTGRETRDFTFVDDHVSGLLLAGSALEGRNEWFDFGTGKETPLIDLAEMINALTLNPAGVRWLPARDWDDQPRRVADPTKAAALIGYSARTPLQAGLIQTIDWFRSNWSLILRHTPPANRVQEECCSAESRDETASQL